MRRVLRDLRALPESNHGRNELSLRPSRCGQTAVASVTMMPRFCLIISLRRVDVQSTESGGGELFLPPDRRAKVPINGVLLF